MRSLLPWKRRDEARGSVLSSLGLRSGAYAAMACAALLGLEAWNVWQDHDARIENIGTVTANMTRSLAQHTEDLLDRADTVLTELAERVSADGTAPEALARLDALLRREASRPPGATAFFVYDAEGRWLASSLPRMPGNLNNADRDYFRHHQGSAEPGPYVGPLIRSRSRGIWVVTLSRRLQGADGRFAGVVLATIEAGYFARFFAGFDLGEQGAAALFRADGTLLARQPFQEKDAGRSYADLPLFRTWLPRADAASYAVLSPFDGVRRWNAYRRTGRYPLVVTAAVSEQEVLAPWYKDIAVRLAVALLLASLLAMLGLRLARQAQHRHEAERALAESEANFRLLTENSSDMVSRVNLEGRRTYVSPAVERLLGCCAADLVGRPSDEFIDPSDLPAVRQAVGQLRAGLVEEAMVTYRIERPDGRALWLESSIRSTRNAVSGALDGAVLVSRDVTERRRLEQQLAALATEDGLTGLANRRAFDMALEQEWRRAMREGTPLCLLLLDVDRFKLFNDGYGHQQGDRCLKAVARVVRACARRPGDMAARYGGEELALLLPNTAAASALNIAEALRAALEAERMPHQGNPPLRVVTASIGLAGITPETQMGFGPEALVAAADSALYAAKHQGRNRVVLAATVPPPAQAAPEPPDEAERLTLVRAYQRAGAARPGDPELDRITRLAARLFNAPVALLSLVEQERQTFVSRFGLEMPETSREVSFCAHALGVAEEILVVPDAAADARFASNPLVAAESGFRFYAGAPLIAPRTEHRLGMLCVMDRVPRPSLDPLQEAVLKDLAALAMSRVEQRRLLAGQEASPVPGSPALPVS
jgi:diguanylate cyclase (GGDEF)-like protein/PAS domain S-box-containing protein